MKCFFETTLRHTISGFILLIFSIVGLRSHAEPSHCKTIPTEINRKLAKHDEMLELYKSLMAEQKFRSNLAERESASEDFDVARPATSEINELSSQIKKLKEKVIFSLVENDKNLTPKKMVSFNRWFACASIKSRIADSDLNRQFVQDRIRFINKRGKIQKPMDTSFGASLKTKRVNRK